MKYFTKILLALSLLVAQSAFADGSTNSAVVDTNGNFVRSILSGECVRTKWDAGMDQCATSKSAGTPAPRMVDSGPSVMKEHKRSYIVFFDFDRYEITTAAKDVLKNLVADTRNARATYFDIVGHADRSGSDAYNLTLSQKRANAVQQELTRLGASSHEITTSWKGESEPLVPTADGIKEPQNRRAEIRVTTKVAK